jgi:hypothetical protein
MSCNCYEEMVKVRDANSVIYFGIWSVVVLFVYTIMRTCDAMIKELKQDFEKEKEINKMFRQLYEAKQKAET